jgi:polyferredoxin
MLKQLNRVLSKAYLPLSLKYLSLGAYVILIITGLAAYSTDPDFLKQLRNTNLGNLIVWSYWWPGIILLAIFFGRIWCMVCPVEIITTFFARIGLKRKRPHWLLSGWAITIFYIIILLVGIQGFSIHRNPFFMSIYLLVIVGVSIIVGAVYEKNTFCRYVCPVGYLLGLYSRFSFIGWRVKNTNVCDSCKDKSCIHKKYQYNLNYKSCGVDLYPANITDNSDCILCAGCLKTCATYQSKKVDERPNPQLTYTGFAKDLFQLKPLKMAELVFVLVVSGFVISEIWSEWAVTDSILGVVPRAVNNVISVENTFISGFIEGIIIFLLMPLILWMLPYTIASLSGTSLKIKDYLMNYGISFIPIIAAAHLDKAILKTTSRLPYFQHLFEDLSGMTTAQKIIDGQIKLQQNPVWMKISVSIMLTLVMGAGIWFSIKVVRLINNRSEFKKSSRSFYLIPIVYGSIFLIMILVWRWF